jgi:PAS domain S-box-containing protein
MKTPTTSKSAAGWDWLAGGSEMGALLRSMDWSKTPIGGFETWSSALKMMVRLLLANRFPLLLCWGPHYCQLYNDAYRPVLGDKHPASLGQPASECFPEIWDVIGPLIDKPFSGGSATWMDDLQLEYIRYDRLEEAHFTVAYSPVPDESMPSGIGGVLATMYEITEQVVGERRRSALRDLGSRSAEAKTAEEACFIAASTLAQYPEDVPFALLYLHDPHRKQAHLAGAAGMEMGSTESPHEIDLSEKPSCEALWPLAQVVRFETMQIVEDLQGKLSSVPPGPWSDPPRSAVVLPIRSNIAHQLAGFLVLGLSSRLQFDQRYLDFCELVTSQVTTAIAYASELVAELTAMNRLHQLSTRLLREAELQPLLEEVLNATIALQGADFGNVQLYNAKTQALEMVAQSGFGQDFLDHFACVNESGAACGRALERAERVIIEDVLTDPDFAPHRAIAAAAGFRAVQSTPLFSRSGELLGMVSTHFRQPHRPSERELRLTDLYALQASELIERKRAEDALHASEEPFRRYFELGLIGMAMTSPTKGILEINDEMCRILGYERSELLQMTWAEITHPDDLAADVAQFNRVMAGEIEGYSLDKRWIRKDGRVIDSIMAAKCLRRADGSVDYFVGLVLDTTERKRAEEKLGESERRFRLLAESIPHHVWSFRPDGSVGYRNQRLIDYTGLAEQDLRSGGWAALHPDDVERVKEAWEKAWALGTKYEMEHRMRGRDGRYRRFVCRAEAVKDAQGRSVEWFGTNTDVEERRQAAEALHKAQAELVHVTRVTTVGQLGTSIAHEMNQPLGAIVNNANFCFRMATARGDLDDMREALTDIVNDANRASAIIARIRAMTRRSLPEKTSLQLREVIADVLAIAHRELAERRIEVRTELPEDLPRVSGDRVQLQQVLLNLVMNGIEAMSGVAGERRVLTIGGHRDELDGRLAVRITVQDLGSGIEPEKMERLFEAFYSTKPQGMGMGLRIGRSIVEAHGGRMWAAPNAGPGAAFFFALPANEELT